MNFIVTKHSADHFEVLHYFDCANVLDNSWWGTHVDPGLHDFCRCGFEGIEFALGGWTGDTNRLGW